MSGCHISKGLLEMTHRRGGIQEGHRGGKARHCAMGTQWLHSIKAMFKERVASVDGIVHEEEGFVSH